VWAKPDRLTRPPRPPPPRRRPPPALAAVDQVKKKSTAARPKARAGFAAALAREEAHKQQLTRAEAQAWLLEKQVTFVTPWFPNSHWNVPSAPIG
jgi:hypothetical protein